MILDDTLIEKSGKKIELIGKVFDHNTHLYRLGMKVLTLGYSDGKSFFPIDFSIHNEPGKTKQRGLKTKELKAQYSKPREEHTPGFKRVLEVSQDKITTSINMIKRNLKNWLRVDYVLADSWFICEKFIKEIKCINSSLNIIGLMKVNRMISIDGKTYKASMIPEIKRKQIHYSNKLKCYYISLKINYKGIEMRGYWVKLKGQNKWNLLISTDENLTFIKVMKHYQIRWSIEICFRDCKQNLGLGECQSNDLDAHIAFISIIYMNYQLLALKKRFEDYETLGVLFKQVKEMILKQTIIEKIWEIILELFDSIFVELGVDWEKFVRKLIDSQNQIVKQMSKSLNSLFSLKQNELV